MVRASSAASEPALTPPPPLPQLEDTHDSRPLVDRLYDKQREHNALVARLKEEKVRLQGGCSLMSSQPLLRMLQS
jgi:hypothetical protein